MDVPHYNRLDACDHCIPLVYAFLVGTFKFHFVFHFLCKPAWIVIQNMSVACGNCEFKYFF